MPTEALRLMLGERHLQQSGNRRVLISRLQQNEQQRPPVSRSESAPSNSDVPTGVPNAELAALIASIVDERMNRQLIQDGGASNSNAQLARLVLRVTFRRASSAVLLHRHKMAAKQPPSLQNHPQGAKTHLLARKSFLLARKKFFTRMIK